MFKSNLKYVICGLAASGILACLPASSSRAQSAPPMPYCTKLDFVPQDSGDEDQEILCIHILANSASRNGNTLTLRFDNGKIKTYQSNPEACQKDEANACLDYRLVGYHPSARLFLLLERGYEDRDCLLISARDGTTTKLPDVPHFAPDGSTFISFDDENGFSIGSVANSPPSWTSTEWADWRDSRTWEFQRWLDMDHIALRTSSQSEACPRGSCEAVLVHDGNSWNIQRNPVK